MNVMNRKDNRIFRTRFFKTSEHISAKRSIVSELLLSLFYIKLLVRDFRASLLFINQTNLNANNHQLKRW